MSKNRGMEDKHGKIGGWGRLAFSFDPGTAYSKNLDMQHLVGMRFETGLSLARYSFMLVCWYCWATYKIYEIRLVDIVL